LNQQQPNIDLLQVKDYQQALFIFSGSGDVEVVNHLLNHYKELIVNLRVTLTEILNMT